MLLCGSSAPEPETVLFRSRAPSQQRVLSLYEKIFNFILWINRYSGFYCKCKPRFYYLKGEHTRKNAGN
jgi:hypothetical protein